MECHKVHNMIRTYHVGKKLPVCRRRIRVIVGAGRAHERHVRVEKRASARQRAGEQSSQLRLERIVTGLEAQMIVKVAPLEPILALAVVDHITNDLALV